MKKSTTINKGSFSRMARLVLVAILTLAFLLEMVPAIAAPVETQAEELTFGVGDDAMTESEINAYIDELYQNETGTNNGRLQKMQAFIYELALHAKKRDPDFKIIPQDGIALAYTNGSETAGNTPAQDIDKGVKALVDGWGIEGVVTANAISTPNQNQRRYQKLSQFGLWVSDTTVTETQAAMDTYYANAELLGIVPYPRIGGALAYETLFPGWRWARNSDYFWIDDLAHIGLGNRVQSAKNINKLTDAKNYLYHINGRPFDAWDTWDEIEEENIADGGRERTNITQGYQCGLLVPSVDGPYTIASGTTGALGNANAAAVATDGKWDWWWRDAGYTADQGRQVWIETLKNSDYDIIYVDPFYNHRNLPEFQTPMTPEEIEYISTKPGGGKRMIIAYLNVGAAEQNRWYCQDDWTHYENDDMNSDRAMKYGTFTGSGSSMVFTPNPDAPSWLVTGYGGAYDEEARVLWWDTEWRDIIINGGGKYSGGKFWDGSDGDNTSSLDRIMDQGFDGVYLDNVGSYSSSSNNYAAAQRWFNAQPGKEVVSNFEFKTPGILGKTYKTSARQSNGTMITMPNISVAAGKRMIWTVTESTHPDVQVGDVVADPTTINVLGSIKFEGSYADAAVTDVTLDNEALALKIGESATLEATVSPADAVNKDVTWTTSDAAVADVVDGVVTAKKAGEADITVTTVDGGLTAVCKVTVSTIPATSITLNHKTLTLKVGHSQSLGTTIAPANVTSHHKTWKSSNPAVATVDSVGKITAVKVGTTDITVTATDGQKSAVCKLTVIPAKIAKPAKVTKVNAKVGKTKANISWKKASKATGYQIAYSTDKKFKAGKQTKTITINKAVTKKLIKQLQSGKTYYFRVRAGNKDANGKMQYGKWSNRVKAKIK